MKERKRRTLVEGYGGNVIYSDGDQTRDGGMPESDERRATWTGVKKKRERSGDGVVREDCSESSTE